MKIGVLYQKKQGQGPTVAGSVTKKMYPTKRIAGDGLHIAEVTKPSARKQKVQVTVVLL